MGYPEVEFDDERDAALGSYGEALGLFGQVGSKVGEANMLQAMGDIQQFRKEMHMALASYEQALDLFGQVGSKLGEANVLQAMGNRHQAKNSARIREEALRGIGTFLASVDRTPSHTTTDDVKEFLLSKRPFHRQDDTRCDFLHEMTSFDQTAMGITPTASNGEPMLQDHGHQLGVNLTEDAHCFLAAPTIHLAVLFPQLPDQLDLPPKPQQYSGLRCAEP